VSQHNSQLRHKPMPNPDLIAATQRTEDLARDIGRLEAQAEFIVEKISTESRDLTPRRRTRQKAGNRRITNQLNGQWEDIVSG
jgi:hypothetical protein